MPYPTGEQVRWRLASMGVTPKEEYDVEADVAAVVRALERATGRKPFLSEGTATTWTGTPDVKTGEAILRIPDFVSVSGITAGGLALDAASYDLLRETEFSDDAPYVAVRFASSPGEVVVSGVRGYCSTLPDDVSVAIIDEAAARYLERHAGEAGAGVTSLKIGSREVQYDSTAGRDVVSRMRSAFTLLGASLARFY